MPVMETDLEPLSMGEGKSSTSTSRKRKRRLTKGEKIREGIRNRCKELDTNMARWMVNLVSGVGPGGSRAQLPRICCQSSLDVQ